MLVVLIPPQILFQQADSKRNTAVLPPRYYFNKQILSGIPRYYLILFLQNKGSLQLLCRTSSAACKIFLASFELARK